jgi:NADH-quinone oxidoreductase subunit K
VNDPLSNYLIVGAILFGLGALGFLTRRNLILMMLSAELMLHGVSLNLVAFSATHGNYQGQAFTAFVLTVAACEAALALALILVLYRRRQTLDVNTWDDLREPQPVTPDAPTEDRLPLPEEKDSPRLTPAGYVPDIEGERHAPRPAPKKLPKETPTHV